MGNAGDSVRVARGVLARLVTEIFSRAGVPADDAAYLADSLVRADARGMHSHGVQRVSQYLPKIAAGGIKAGTHGKVASENGAVVVIDGEDGIGQLLSRHAMTLAIAKARAHGLGLALVRDSNHHGESGSYAMMAAREGMIGIVTSNGSPSAPAWGGANPRVTGPWPLAIAAPAMQEPVVLDMALGVVAKGRIQHYANTGQKLPPGWGYDRTGVATEDPKAVLDGGWNAFIGDYKGWGLLLMIEVLTGVLSGGRIADEITDLFAGPAGSPQGLSHFLLAINVSAVQPSGGFAARMDGMIRKLKASELAAGSTEVLMPGEREFRNERRADTEGIMLAGGVAKDLHSAACKTGCPDDVIRAAFPALQ
ncbi:MAG: Ldh family oxidoreductase [Burkholderiales bacterium]